MGQPLRDLTEGLVIGAITRDGSNVMTGGNTTVEHGEHGVILADSDAVEETVSQV